MKKYWIVVAALLITSTSFALDPFEITATKKTEHKRESSSQDLPRGSSEYEVKYMTYEFGVKRTSTQAPEDCITEWIVFVEQQSGQIKIATKGKSVINLPFNQTQLITTDTFKLDKREWSGGATVEDKILGYAFRVMDQSGNLLYEEYEPRSLQEEAKWRLEEQQKAVAPKQAQPERRRPWKNPFKKSNQP